MTETLPIAAPPETQEKPKEKKFVSAGRRVHNEITYRGVDFLLNSLVGIGFTYFTQRTEIGNRIWAEPVSNFFKAVLKPMLKSPEALAQGAKRGSMFTSIIVGGTAIITPMVLLENKKHKKNIIQAVNTKIHGEEKVENDPRFARELAAIDDEPKKNFGVGMAARLIVLAPMIAATTNPAVDKYLVKWLYNPISTGTRGMCHALGIRPKSLLERGAMEVVDGDLTKGMARVSDWDFIHKVAGFDFGLTFIYSFAHEGVIKTLAAMGFRRTEDDVPDPLFLPGDKIHQAPPEAAPPAAQRTHAPQTTASITEYRPPVLPAEVML